MLVHLGRTIAIVSLVLKVYGRLKVVSGGTTNSSVGVFLRSFSEISKRGLTLVTDQERKIELPIDNLMQIHWFIS